MIKRSNIRRPPPASAPRPSRIRREPVPVAIERPASLKRFDFTTREWEIGLALAGIVFFALAINAFVFDFGELLSR